MGMKGTFLGREGRGTRPILLANTRPSCYHRRVMMKAYRYRIYPTKKQTRLLNEWLALCCEVYNAALQERRDAYRMASTSIGYSQQCAELPGCKEVRPELAAVNSQVLQNVLKRVDLAFDSFFRRVAAGQQAGYPRFRSRQRYDSLTFKQYGNSFSFSQEGKLILSKIGQIKIVLHRPFKGVPKTATVSRSPTGKWSVSISCDGVEPVKLPASEQQVGVDVGLKTFAYLSDGTAIENPRFFREEPKHLAKAQRKLSKAQKGTSERRKRRKVVARIHERIRQRRENFVQQAARRLVNQYGLIALEALIVRNLLKNPTLAKSISDAAWSAFIRVLLDKAAEADRAVIRVNPAYTSQTCSGCSHRQEMPLSVRIWECERCSLMLDRDQNASLNILAQAVGRHGHVIQEAPAL
jgi:putative transposase